VPSATPALEVSRLATGYGKSQVLNGVTMSLRWKEVTSVIGPNGAGKSTLLKAIMGVLPFRSGSMRLAGEDVTGQPTHTLLRKGLALVPEGARVFAPLTVRENLELGGLVLRDRKVVSARVREMFELFPHLAGRKAQLAGTLSGGERQMLAVARGLMINPRILLLDEPSLGLAPLFVELIMTTLRSLVDQHGIAICLVEQNAPAALSISDRAYILDVGQIVHESDDPPTLLASPELLRFLEAH